MWLLTKYSNWKFIVWKCRKVQISERNCNNNTNDICEEIKHRINMRIAGYFSLDKILSFLLLSKKLTVNTYEGHFKSNAHDIFY